MRNVSFHEIINTDLFLESELAHHPELSDRTVVVGHYMTGELVFRCLDDSDKAILLNDPMRQGMKKTFHLFFHADGTRRAT